MAVITFSRQTGSMGDEIAPRVATALGYEFLDKEAIHKQISTYKADFSKELDLIDQESQPGFFDQFVSNRSIYFNLLNSLIFSAAANDNVLIVGRGAQFTLNGYPFVLRARIISPYQKRIERVQNKRGADRRLAEKIVNRADQERSGFINYVYQKDINKSLAYDIIINTEMFDVQNTADILVHKIKALETSCPLTDEAKTFLKNRSLESIVKATIRKEIVESIHIEVDVETEGEINLSGYISSEEERKKTEQCAASVAGVTSVTNRIIVFQSI